MSVIDILSNGNYIVVNKKIASDLGLYEAILLGELASEHKYWANIEKLEDGFFYSTVENIKEMFGITPYNLNKIKLYGVFL